MVKSCIFFCKTLPWFVTANNDDKHCIRYSVETFILLHIFYPYDNSWTIHTYILFLHIIYMYVHWLQVHEKKITKWCSMFVSRNLKSVMWQTIICIFSCRCIRTIYNKSSFISIKLVNPLLTWIPWVVTCLSVKTFTYQKSSKVTTYWKTCKHELGLSALEIHY